MNYFVDGVGELLGFLRNFNWGISNYLNEDSIAIVDYIEGNSIRAVQESWSFWLLKYLTEIKFILNVIEHYSQLIINLG